MTNKLNHHNSLNCLVFCEFKNFSDLKSIKYNECCMSLKMNFILKYKTNNLCLFKHCFRPWFVYLADFTFFQLLLILLGTKQIQNVVNGTSNAARNQFKSAGLNPCFAPKFLFPFNSISVRVGVNYFEMLKNNYNFVNHLQSQLLWQIWIITFQLHVH